MSEYLVKAEGALANSKGFPGTTAEISGLQRAIGYILDHLRALDSASASPPPSVRPASSRVSEEGP